MAVGAPTGLANGSDTTALTAYSTASQSPTANRIILGIVLSTDTSERPQVPTLTGNGLTWVFLGSVFHSTSGTNRYRCSAYAALTGSSPSAGSVTITHATSQSGCAWSFAEFPGTYLTSVADAIRQVAFGQAPDTHQSVEAHLRVGQGADNAIWSGMSKVNTAETVTPGSGFTEIHEVTLATPDGIVQSQYRLGTATLADATWTTTNREGGIIAVELRAATNPIDVREHDLLTLRRRRRTFKTAPISINTAADNLIFTTTANKQAFIYGIYLVSEGTVTVMLETPTTDYAPIPLQAGEGYKQWVDPPGFILLPLRDSTFEINLNAAVQVDGWVAYWEEDI
jgi:hypothetical protein